METLVADSLAVTLGISLTLYLWASVSLARNVERVECSCSEGTSASSTVTLDIRIEYIKD